MWLPSFVRVRAIPTSFLSLSEMSRFVTQPLTTGHQFTVICKPRTLFLGRDLLNAHVQFMDEHNLVSSLYDSNDILNSPAVVVRSEAYWNRIESRDTMTLENLVKKILTSSQSIKNRALPLDIAEFETSCFGQKDSLPDCINLYLTTRTQMKLSTVLDMKLTRHVAVALDAIVRHPLWLSLVSFFAAPMQYLTFSFPVEQFGKASYGGV